MLQENQKQSKKRRSTYMPISSLPSKECQVCGKIYTRRSSNGALRAPKLFDKSRTCGTDCRRIDSRNFFGKKMIEGKLCDSCGKPYNRRNKETRAQYIKRKFCGKSCKYQYISQANMATKSKGNPSRQACLQRLKRIMPKVDCERCAGFNRLSYHHINRDKFDNRPENIEILCNICHGKEHYEERREAIMAGNKKRHLDMRHHVDLCRRFLNGQIESLVLGSQEVRLKAKQL